MFYLSKSKQSMAKFKEIPKTLCIVNCLWTVVDFEYGRHRKLQSWRCILWEGTQLLQVTAQGANLRSETSFFWGFWI